MLLVGFEPFKDLYFNKVTNSLIDCAVMTDTLGTYLRK